jgi:hypothetical protein
MEETLTNMPQVFLEREASQVREELDILHGLADRFRSGSRVSALSTVKRCARLISRMGLSSCSISSPSRN